MKTFLITIFAAFCLIQCASTRTPEMGFQTFSRIPVNAENLEKKDYAEIFKIMNDKYADGQNVFNEISVINENGSFLYLRAFSAADDNTCYRITIDRNRSAIINIVPDCPQEY